MITVDTKPQWSKRDEQGVRSFLPYGKATRRRFLLKNAEGVVIDRCGVHNTEEAIAATFAELCRLEQVRGVDTTGFTFELGEVL